MANDSRYGLSRRTRKYTCPGCSCKSFTYYVDNGYNPADEKDKKLDLQLVDGEYILGSGYGRCDHESGCGYHRTPKDFFTDRKINGNAYINRYVPVNVKQKEIIPIHESWVAATMFNKNGELNISGLFKWIWSLEWTEDERSRIFTAVADYRLGACKQAVDKWNSDLQMRVTSEDKGVVFWYIDANNIVLNGKMMWYKSDGHRDKLIKPDSIKYQLIKRGVFPKDYEVRQCAYGEHLLNEPRHAGKPVYIVESEKTAILMSIRLPQFLWIAISSKGNLNERYLHALKERKRKIFLVPDKDGWWSEDKERELVMEVDEDKKRRLEQIKKNAWNIRYRELKKWYYDIGINDCFVKTGCTVVDGENCDIADVIVRLMKGRNVEEPNYTTECIGVVEPHKTEVQPRSVTVMTESLQLLIDTFDCEIVQTEGI